RAEADLQFRAAYLDAEIHSPPLQRNSPMQIVHHPVKRGQMNRLDDAHVIQRYVQPALRQRSQLAAIKAGAAESLQAVAVGPFDCSQHVGTVARATDADEQVPGAGQVLELLDEDALKAFVIAPGKNVGRVVGQAEDAE